MNVIETVNGELYKAVPHFPSDSYEKNVYYERTDQEVADYIDYCYDKCEAEGNKVHTFKKWWMCTNIEKEYYLKAFRIDHNKIVGQEIVNITYPQSGWFVSTTKWCRIFSNAEIVNVWDERK